MVTILMVQRALSMGQVVFEVANVFQIVLGIQSSFPLTVTVLKRTFKGNPVFPKVFAFAIWIAIPVLSFVSVSIRKSLNTLSRF